MPNSSNMTDHIVGQGTVRSVPCLLAATDESALHQWAAALGQRPKGFIGRDGGAQLVIIPRRLGFRRLLYFEQIHRVDLAAVGSDHSLAEELVVGRHLFRLGDDRLAVSVALELF